MGLRSEDDEGAPRAVTLADPTVGEERVLLLKDDLGFVGPITRLATADRLGTTSVNSEFETEDSLADASLVKDIPIFLDHRFDVATSCEIDMGANANMLGKFRSVASTVPEVDVGARGFKDGWESTHRFAILSEDQ
jgi:hypothetical protein